MIQQNRLETTWTPKWDLGLQVEFGFAEAEAKSTDETAEVTVSGWAKASRETQAQNRGIDRRIAPEGSSIGELIAFFENLYLEEGANHE